MSAPSSPRSSHSASFEPIDLHATPQSLARAMLARRSEYVRPCSLRVKIGTWNVAACRGTDKDLAAWFVDGQGIDQRFAGLDLSRNPAVAGESDTDSARLLGGNDIGLYVLGLQEVVDLNLTREYMTRAVKVDTSSTELWQAALEAAMPSGYQLIVSEQMTGLLLLIYASPTVAPTITNVSTKQIGTGLLGYFGNKGAIASRLVLGETTRLVFVNCHLASGAASSHLERRCQDVEQIMSKTKFDPVVHAGVSEDEGELIGDEDFAFWFGDLNFRLADLPGDDIRRILTLHTRGEYGLSADQKPQPLDGGGVIVMRSSESDDDATVRSSIHSRAESFDSATTLPDADDLPQDPSQNPSSLQATLDSLLPHDQLRQVIAQRKAFHDGWREGPVTFLPTYKYDVGTTSLFDSSDKQRSPSWCDRILYRTRQDKKDYDTRLREEQDVKKKDEEMRMRGIEEDDDVLFSYDPGVDGDDHLVHAPAADYDEYNEAEDMEVGQVITKDGYMDRISLAIYTSHQRISSSDHKPVISVFNLAYEAVAPELKAGVHAEVARELDRAENERRPAVTIVLEGLPDASAIAVDFGCIGFLEKKSCCLTVANTGGVTADVSFVETPTMEEGNGAPLTWLALSFLRQDDSSPHQPSSSMTLEPGETVTALVEAHISTVSHLRSLNDGLTSLEDVLVLRVDGGRDHFIPVKGVWLSTCFGRSVDELIRVPDGGIRKFVTDRNIQGAIPYDSEVRCSAPKELFKLTEAVQTLAERCMADAAMLEDMAIPHDAGWPFDASTWTAESAAQDQVKAQLVEALDTDASITEVLPVEYTSLHKLEILSSILLLFLASLTDGLVPPILWARLSTTLPNLTSCAPATWSEVKAQILDIFSSAPNHSIAFVFLTSTLSRVVTETSPALPGPPQALARRLSFMKAADDDSERGRKLRQRKYAEVFAPLVFRSSGTDKATRERERMVLEVFLSREGAG